VEDHDALRELNKNRRERMRVYPNLVDYEATWAFKPMYKPEPMPVTGSPLTDIKISRTLFGGVKRKTFNRRFVRSDEQARTVREKIRIGMPKALNMWSTAPFWRAYFETLGVPTRN